MRKDLGNAIARLSGTKPITLAKVHGETRVVTEQGDLEALDD
jgi:hypothetical protein